MVVVTRRKVESTTGAPQIRSSVRMADAQNALYGGVKGVRMAQTLRQNVGTEGFRTAVSGGSKKKGGNLLSMHVRLETTNVAAWL